jgi:hypothetical protein
MATWNQIRKGTRARRRVVLPLSDGPIPLYTREGKLELDPANAEVVQLDLRPLTSGEQSDVLARAHADAVARGVQDPRAGNPIYDLAEMEHTLLLCCVDPDSPQEAPMPLFASIEEIRRDPALGSDRVVYLFELFQQFQDECSPQRRHLTLDEAIASMLLLAGEEEDARRFFESLGPGLRWICMRTLALQLQISQTPSSPSGSPSERKDSGSPTWPPSPPTPQAPGAALADPAPPAGHTPPAGPGASAGARLPTPPVRPGASHPPPSGPAPPARASSQAPGPLPLSKGCAGATQPGSSPHSRRRRG